MIFFPERSGVGGGIIFPATSIPRDDHIMKTWKHDMVAYLMKILDP